MFYDANVTLSNYPLSNVTCLVKMLKCFLCLGVKGVWIDSWLFDFCVWCSSAHCIQAGLIKNYLCLFKLLFKPFRYRELKQLVVYLCRISRPSGQTSNSQ